MSTDKPEPTPPTPRDPQAIKEEILEQTVEIGLGTREVNTGENIRVVDIKELESFAAKEIKPPPKEWVQANLAFVLLAILGGTIVIHYAITTTLLLYNNPPIKDFEEKYKPLGQIFNTLLPILSGLVSSAITYYFTREIQSASKAPSETK